MQNSHPLQSLIEPIVEGLGYELIRILSMGIKGATLQIMIDRKDGKNIVVEDCAKVSRAISEVMDEEDPISDEYNLEVSSPGLDRPLTKIAHFDRFLGQVVKFDTTEDVLERRRFKGIVKEIKENEVLVFEMDGKEYEIPSNLITKAKLVLTDELLAQYEEELA